MPEQLFGNVSSTTVAGGGITSTATSMTVTSSANFPIAVSTQDKEFRAAFVDAAAPPNILEYITVRNVSGQVWTIIRASEDPTRFPAGARADGTRVVMVATADTLRNLLPKNRNPYHDVRDFGAVGTASTPDAGSVDCTQAFIDAAEKANECNTGQIYKTDDLNGTGRVYVPGNRDYKVTATMDWPINVHLYGGLGGGNGIGLPPRIRWHGAAGGIMFQTLGTGNNIPGVSASFVTLHGRSYAGADNAGFGNGAGTAWHFGPHPSTPEAVAKPDTGCMFVDTIVVGFHDYGIKFTSKGLTNWVWERGRFDLIGKYAIYVKTDDGAFLTIHDMTWDSGNVANEHQGFLFLDGEAQTLNAKSYCQISNCHFEVNNLPAQSYVPTGWTPAGTDTRGLIRFGISPVMPGVVQHMFDFHNIWIARPSTAGPMSMFQLTSSDLTADNRTRHAQAVRITGSAIHGVSGLIAQTQETTGVMTMLGGVHAADQYPYLPGSTLGTWQANQFSYAPSTSASIPQGEKSVSYFRGRTHVDGLALPQSATVGAAGGGAALPATPVKYLIVYDDLGNQYKVPAYNV